MISVECTKVYREVRYSLTEVRRVAALVLKGERVTNASVHIIFTDDTGIKAIHAKFLYQQRVTDIITFHLEEKPLTAEIYINVQQAKRQAKEFGVSTANEITRLIVHGLLHCRGYNDNNESARKKMFIVQERYVEKIC